MSLQVLWVWEPRGDHTCPECASMPMYTWYRQVRPHQHCDCATWEGAFSGYMEYENVQWEDIGYQEIGRVVKSVHKNDGETPKTVNVEYSSSDAVEVSITISTSLGFSAGDIEASVTSEVTQSVSSETGVSVSETVEIPAGQELVIYDITYRGQLLIFADQVYVTSGGPHLPAGEVRGGIDQIGTGNYTFHGYDYDFR